MTMYDARLPAEGGTPTERRGVFIMPRLRDFEFDKGLRRLWFDGSLPLTSFWSVIHCFATVGEIGDGVVQNPAVLDGCDAAPRALSGFMAEPVAQRTQLNAAVSR